MRVMGWTWKEVWAGINKEFPEIPDGLSEATIIKWVNAHIKPAMEESVEEYRQHQLNEIALAKRAIMPRVQKGDDKAIASLSRLQDREAKLLGMDKPVQVQLETKVVDHQTEADVLLERLVRAKATGQVITGELVQKAIEG